MLVDRGSKNFCINKEIQEQLKFTVVEKRKAETTDCQIVECDVVDNVQLRFRNSATTCSAIILPGDCEPFLSAISLEDMDVFIHPQRQELIVNPSHPYFAQIKLK